MKSVATRIEPERLENLVQRLRGGDRSVANEIICGHLGLAYSIANIFTNDEDQRDEVVSAALFGLVQAVEWSASGRLYDNNITPYIYSTMRSFINRHFSDIAPIPGYSLTNTVYMDDYDSEIESTYMPTTVDDYEFITDELLEMLSDEDRELINFILEGYTITEIASKLNVSVGTVTYRKYKIQERLLHNDLCNRHGRCTG